jgi:hypothetical protein
VKKLCHKWGWNWDHTFPGDAGEDGRWGISLYSFNDLSEDGFRGYAALAPLDNGRWVVIIRIKEEGEK